MIILHHSGVRLDAIGRHLPAVIAPHVLAVSTSVTATQRFLSLYQWKAYILLISFSVAKDGSLAAVFTLRNRQLTRGGVVVS